MISTGKFGPYGGVYVPETLMGPLEELEQAFLAATKSEPFLHELQYLMANFAGRPTPLFYAKNISQKWGAQIYLKREDLLHGGAHKTNNALGQALLAKSMGKTRIIAETGAGQHGVACAMAGALLGMETIVYMGAIDMERQEPNVHRMRLLGTTAFIQSQPAARHSKMLSTRRCATGSPMSAIPTICLAPWRARTLSRQ